MGRKNRRKMRPADDVLRELAAEIIAKDRATVEAIQEIDSERDRVATFDRTFAKVISGLFLLVLILAIIVFVKGVTP